MRGIIAITGSGGVATMSSSVRQALVAIHEQRHEANAEGERPTAPPALIIVPVRADGPQGRLAGSMMLNCSPIWRRSRLAEMLRVLLLRRAGDVQPAQCLVVARQGHEFRLAGGRRFDACLVLGQHAAQALFLGRLPGHLPVEGLDLELAGRGCGPRAGPRRPDRGRDAAGHAAATGPPARPSARGRRRPCVRDARRGARASGAVSNCGEPRRAASSCCAAERCRPVPRASRTTGAGGARRGHRPACARGSGARSRSRFADSTIVCNCSLRVLDDLQVRLDLGGQLAAVAPAEVLEPLLVLEQPLARAPRAGSRGTGSVPSASTSRSRRFSSMKSDARRSVTRCAVRAFS